MTPHLKSHIEERTQHIAGALETDQLQSLLADNNLFVRPQLIDKDRLASLPPDSYLQDHLQKTAEGFTVGEIQASWSRRDMDNKRTAAVCTSERKRLYDWCGANTPAQMVALAAEAGHIILPSLVLDEPYRFSPFETTVIGLWRRGLTTKVIAGILDVPSLYGGGARYFQDLIAKLPPDEPLPREKNNPPWFVYIARRLGLFAFTLDAAEHLPPALLTRRLVSLLDKRRPFTATNAGSLQQMLEKV